jgi:hypothetical protein
MQNSVSSARPLSRMSVRTAEPSFLQPPSSVWSAHTRSLNLRRLPVSRASVRRRIHPRAPCQEDPHFQERPRRGAEAGHRPLCRRDGFHVAVGAARPRGGSWSHDASLRADAGRGPSLRGHREPVPRRRHHGSFRGSSRARESRPARRPRRPGNPNSARPGSGMP